MVLIACAAGGMSRRRWGAAGIVAGCALVLAGCGSSSSSGSGGGGGDGGNSSSGGGGGDGGGGGEPHDVKTTSTVPGPTATSTTSTATSTTLTSTSSTTYTGPLPGPVPCSEKQLRGHCSACEWVGFADGHEKCSTCQAPYVLDEAAPAGAESACTFDCANFQAKEKPGFPPNAQSYNGIDWPAMCINEEKSHFFTIGDWGGVCGWGGRPCNPSVVPFDLVTCSGNPNKGLPGKPCPMPNRASGFYRDFEGRIQWMISQRMKDRFGELAAAGTPPRYVINVGDNFYPGGIDLHCGNTDMAGKGTQFQQVWRNMYPSPLTDIEWWGVLGNHDYGGVCYLKGWDQQIFHTWHDSSWVMPGQYWKRTVQYKTFSAEFFFIDANQYDVQFGAPGHNMCDEKSNPGEYCEGQVGGLYPPQHEDQPQACPATGPQGPGDCRRWFAELWDSNFRWMQEHLSKSEADWQIIVNHYPATYSLGDAGRKTWIEWRKFLEPMGVDLYIAGHTHHQHIYVGEEGVHDMGKTGWVITGGGGGVSSEGPPENNGQDDMYGFMDIEISLNEITIRAYSHGGLDGKLIVRQQKTVQPVPRKPLGELLALELIRAEHAVREDPAFVF